MKLNLGSIVLIVVLALGAATAAGVSYGVQMQKNTIALHDKTPTIGSYCHTAWDTQVYPQVWKDMRKGAACATLSEVNPKAKTLEEFNFKVVLSNGTEAEFSRWYDAVEWLDEQPAP